MVFTGANHARTYCLDSGNPSLTAKIVQDVLNPGVLAELTCAWRLQNDTEERSSFQE